MSCGLSLEEIHRASYLTFKGWEYTTYGGWSKEGVTRTVKRSRNCCSGCEENVTTTFFESTEEAYWHQKELEDHGKL